MEYTVVVYDYFGDPVRRIPESDLQVAKTLADYFTDDLCDAVIFEKIVIDNQDCSR